MRMPLAILVVVSILSASRVAHADRILRVGTGSGCDAASIQQAIDAADNVDGTTWIRITRTLAYTGQQLDINGKNVVLTGGYADCQQVDEDALHTSIGGLASANRPVVTVRGSTTFVGLYKLDIHDNHNAGSAPGAGSGGAIAVRGGPHRLVGLGDDAIDSNAAIFGGGLHVHNEVSTDPTDVSVLIGANVTISNNSANAGGGVWCADATTIMSFPGSAIVANVASGAGGGIRAEHCNVDVGGAQSGLGSVSFNIAGGDGGGISAVASTLRLYTTDAANPTLLSTNIAGGVGGALALGSNSTAAAWDVVIEGNAGRSGGGAVAIDETSDDGIDAAFVMRGDQLDAPDDPNSWSRVAVACAPALRCNRIAWNAAAALDGTQQPGAAILARSAGDDGIGNASALQWFLFGVEVHANAGLNLVTSMGDFASGTMRGTALFANTASADLLELDAPTSSVLDIHSSTIAGNTSAGTRSIHRSSGTALVFEHGIHWQPGKRIQAGVGSSNVDIDYVIANDLDNVAPSTHNLVADPQFVDAAANDFRLRIDSPALDYAPATLDPAAGHQVRVVDLPAIANEFGAQDAGAYERQDACGDDTVFCNGFEQ